MSIVSNWLAAATVEAEEVQNKSGTEPWKTASRKQLHTTHQTEPQMVSVLILAQLAHS